VLEVINELTGEGKRLIGSAQKDMSGGRKQIEGRDAKTDLRWLGMLAFSDPVRRGVKEALELSRKAGIQTMVITGDYAKTSEFVLAELGMAVDEKQIITGEELGAMTPTKLAQMVKTIRRNGGDVWFLLAKDEGHGFKKKSNRDAYTNATAVFLERVLH